MEYRKFKDIHANDKIIVAGLGMSTLELKDRHKDYVVIGVNDIERLLVPNYLVVLNDRQTFLAERWEYIKDPRCGTVFTHIKHLAVPEDKKCVIKLGRYGSCDFNKDSVDYTSNSPYVACMIAAFMGAKKIGLIGVDFTQHHFFKKSGEHSLARKVNTINKEYESMHRAFKGLSRSESVV